MGKTVRWFALRYAANKPVSKKFESAGKQRRAKVIHARKRLRHREPVEQAARECYLTYAQILS